MVYDFETPAKKSRVNRTTKCKSVPRANRAHQNFPFETFQCGCSYAGCISLIGGPAQAKFLRETLDNLLKETPDSGQVRQSHFLAQFIDFSGFDKAERAKYCYRLWNSVNVKVNVCMAAFTAVFGISEKRLRTMRNSLTGLIQPRLPQTGHSSSVNKTSSATEDAVRNHIRSFPARGSHYSREKNKRSMFLDSDLDCMKLWDLYKEANPDFPVSYRIYYNIFHREYNIKFGFPRSDQCKNCDRYKKLTTEASR